VNERRGERRDERHGEQRVTVREAAEALGISKDAVRMRVKRGTLRHEKDEQGTVYVWVAVAHADANAVHSQAEVEASEHVASLQDQIRYLREQLDAEREARTEERRRHDTLLAQLMQRIPELEAPQQQPGGSETVEEQQGRGQPRPDAPGAQEGARRSWWRRVFGG
jgi:excisionase family DNA binding protein